MKRLILGFIAVLLAACGGNAPPGESTLSSEEARWAARAQKVTITRDEWGIPHIEAPTDSDAVFGMMYAQAEDDFPRIERNFLFSQGRLGEAFGPDFRWIDLRMKLFIDPDEMKQEYDQSPPWLQALMDAWADGLNYYLATHPDADVKVLTRFEPWMALSFSEGSIGGDIERVRPEALAAFYQNEPLSQWDQGTGAHSAIRAVASQGEALGLPSASVGSNGFAVSPLKSESGNALLLINPHTSFYFRHEAHVKSDEGLNAYGASTWGQFFVYQGFNETAGWMHTSSAVDNIDEFEESIVRQEDGLFYRYGDELRPVEQKTVTVRLRQEDGTFTEERYPTYRTHHGPIVRADGDRWIAVALMEEPRKALIQSYARTKAKNLDEFLKIMESHTNSSNNTVFADAAGNIAYLHSNFVPKRRGDLDYLNPVDGSDPSTDWQGLHTIEESPNSINPPTGWVQNTNNWPYSAAGAEHSPRQKDYPPYMDSGSENARGIHALALLEPMTAVDLDGLVTLAYDEALPAFDELLPPLFAAFAGLSGDAPAKARLAPAIAQLDAWDRRYAIDSVATAVAIFWGDALRAAVRDEARANRWNMLTVMAEAAPAVQLKALEEALARLETGFGTWETPWGEINRFQRLSGAIDLRYDDSAPSLPVAFTSSFWGSLAAFGAAPRNGTQRWYGNRGNSFVAVVEFGEKVRARAITAGGLSRIPGDRHFDDQAERYASGDLREVYFYPEAIAAHSLGTYRPGEPRP
jgi:acyl-homoserine-lactone acylase